VDNSPQDDIPPLSGDFNMDGGLYRPVHLIVTDPLCISPLNMASPGRSKSRPSSQTAGPPLPISRSKRRSPTLPASSSPPARKPLRSSPGPPGRFSRPSLSPRPISGMAVRTHGSTQPLFRS
jgi:hypothetical protein